MFDDLNLAESLMVAMGAVVLLAVLRAVSWSDIQRTTDLGLLLLYYRTGLFCIHSYKNL